MAKLSEIFDLQMGKTPARSNSGYWTAGTNRWVSIADLSGYEKYVEDTRERVTDRAVRESGIKAVPPNTVIMSFKLSLGKTAITREAVYTNEAIMAFIPKGRYEIFPDYFFYLFSEKDWSEGTNRAVMGATLNKAALGKMEVSVPPIEVQRHAAAVLDRTTDLISLHRRQLAGLDELVRARFAEMFGEIHSSKRYPYRAVGELAAVVSGGTPSRAVAEYWEGGTIPWVKTTQLQNSRITAADEYITRAGLEHSAAKMVPAGTVLVAMYGQGKTRGMTAYLDIEASTNQACACILPSEGINQVYLWQYLAFSYERLRNLSKGGNQLNLSSGMVKKFPVLLPPAPLQNEFAAFFQRTDRQKTVIRQSLGKLEALKRSLMRHYFG